jgi:hypothetical protein
VDGIDAAQDREKWTVVNTVTKFRFSWNVEISWLYENLLPSQEGLCSSYLVSYLVSSVGTAESGWNYDSILTLLGSGH